MSKKRDDEEIFLYSPRQTWLMGIGVSVVVLGMVIGFVAALMEPSPNASMTHKLVGTAMMAALVFGLAGVGISAVRRGVLVSSDGITLRTMRGSHRIAWDEIDRFSVEPMAYSTVGRVHLRDGGTLDTPGIEGPNRFLFPNSVEATEPIAQLNALLQQHRSNAL